MEAHLRRLTLLRQALDDSKAEFRPGQEDAVQAVFTPPFRAVVVQATGWGKSMVYFLATRMLRDQGKGPTLVISPLLSLMRDQLRAASRLGLKAAHYTSGNEEDWPAVEADLKKGVTDLLLISPERLASDSFRDLIASSSLAKVGLVVIDEAHCISDWGHDFRPDYQRLGAMIRKLPPTTSVLATTATANSRVVEDIQAQIGPATKTLRGSLARKSLRLQVVAGLDVAERLAWLSDHLDDLPGSGIIYTLTIRDAERVARWLQSRGHAVLAYHARLGETRGGDEERVEREDLLLKNDVKALVSTVALGMGFDKPDLGFVVHYQSPGNLVAYYQQIGRAGRAIDDAVAVLFMANEDADIHRWFVENARPHEAGVRAVLDTLENGPRSIARLANALNLTRREIERILTTLSVTTPSPVVKVGRDWQRTLVLYTQDVEREKRLKERRSLERAKFEDFAKTGKCLMMVVREELDDPSAEPCGRCANCLNAEILPSTFDPDTLQSALLFLRRSEVPIQPRKLWPAKALTKYGFTGKIPDQNRCREGLCLSLWGDPGVARWVREDKLRGHYRDELVDAAVEAIRRSPFDNLGWICAVPSLRSLTAVPNFVRRLASALGLPFADAVSKIKETEPQKKQLNSFHQAANLDGAFAVGDCPPGTALLVDDLVDSGWTFAIIGALLVEAGAGAVIPLALCSSRSRGDDDE